MIHVTDVRVRGLLGTYRGKEAERGVAGVRYRHDADLFIEIGEEAGLEELTAEDAALACRPYLELVPGMWDQGRLARCDRAVQDLARSDVWGR